jgi:hypothetical protein
LRFLGSKLVYPKEGYMHLRVRKLHGKASFSALARAFNQGSAATEEGGLLLPNMDDAAAVNAFARIHHFGYEVIGIPDNTRLFSNYQATYEKGGLKKRS